ncbi:MAG: 4Fe-4S binding protein [Elusimicrobiaceae bacterium]|nr:4Fe-4S binding protein [Elusimicrobiaceae bacterium]
MITVKPNCIGCGKCVPVCPFGALSLKDGKIVVSSACTMCGACIKECPVQALEMPVKTSTAKDLSAYKGVWIYVETIIDCGKEIVRPVSLELLSKGRELAGILNEDLCAVVISEDATKLHDEISSYGTNKIYSVSDAGYKDYNTAAYSAVVVNLIEKYKPSMILYPSTYEGRDVSPRVAAEVFCGLTADCTALSIKEGNLVQTRPAFGGNIMADILCPEHRPQMATVRPNVMKKAEPNADNKAEIIEEKIAVSKEVVISGGRGMKNKEGFKMLNDLADTLGGSVGASRAAIDMGLIPKKAQVGQSGVTVSPKVYIACGISGAVQHLVGMENSDTVIAVNKDPQAPIFNACKIGLVGDANQVIPKIIEGVEKKQK